ncbi:hypothetical protein [Azospirillum sp. sgz301742]
MQQNLSEYGSKESLSVVKSADQGAGEARAGQRTALVRSLTAALMPAIAQRAEAAVQAAVELATELADAVGRDRAGRPGALRPKTRAAAAAKAASILRGLAALAQPGDGAVDAERSGQWASIDVALVMIGDGRTEEGAEALWRAAIPPGAEPGWRAAYEAARHAAKWVSGLGLGKAEAREMGRLAEEALAANPFAPWTGLLATIARHARAAQPKGEQADGEAMIAAGRKALKMVEAALRR